MDPLHLILLNGPPRCGKDTAAELITDLVRRSLHLKFAAPLREWVESVGNVTADGGGLYDLDQFKDTPCMMGRTPREAMISLSEDFAKKLWGPGVFGKILAGRLLADLKQPWIDEAPLKVVVVSDCGFLGEIQALLDIIKGQHYPIETTIVNVYRPNCTYLGDSRGWVTRDLLAGYEVTQESLLNDGDKLYLAREILGLLERIGVKL